LGAYHHRLRDSSDEDIIKTGQNRRNLFLPFPFKPKINIPKSNKN